MALLAYFAVIRALARPRRLAVITFSLMVAAVGALLALSLVLGPQARDYALPAAFLVFFLQLLFGVPIGFVLLEVSWTLISIFALYRGWRTT